MKTSCWNQAQTTRKPKYQEFKTILKAIPEVVSNYSLVQALALTPAGVVPLTSYGSWFYNVFQLSDDTPDRCQRVSCNPSRNVTS